VFGKRRSPGAGEEWRLRRSELSAGCSDEAVGVTFDGRTRYCYENSRILWRMKLKSSLTNIVSVALRSKFESNPPWKGEYVKLFKSDDEKRAEFYTDLVDEYRDRLLKFACARIRNYADAEDVVEEALYTAWERIDTLMSSPNPAGWLFNTLKYHIMKYIESEKARQGFEVAMTHEIETGVSFPEPDDEGGELGIAALLTEDEMRIVRLKERGYTHHEIAKMIDKPYGTVASKISRLKAKITRMLDGEKPV
jgi:RNA polymerase sigma-70 factor (ECF subfamily)